MIQKKSLKKAKYNRIKCEVCWHDFYFPYTGSIYFNNIPKVCSVDCFLFLLFNFEYDMTLEKISEIAVSENKTFSCFRSEYEEDFAIFLSNNGISFYYEPFVFRVEDGLSYTPDFLLYHNLIFFEIKGIWEPKSKRKFLSFIKNIGLPIYLIDGLFLDFLKRGKW